VRLETIVTYARVRAWDFACARDLMATPMATLRKLENLPKYRDAFLSLVLNFSFIYQNQSTKLALRLKFISKFLSKMYSSRAACGHILKDDGTASESGINRFYGSVVVIFQDDRGGNRAIEGKSLIILTRSKGEPRAGRKSSKIMTSGRNYAY